MIIIWNRNINWFKPLCFFFWTRIIRKDNMNYKTNLYTKKRKEKKRKFQWLSRGCKDEYYIKQYSYDQFRSFSTIIYTIADQLSEDTDLLPVQILWSFLFSLSYFIKYVICVIYSNYLYNYKFVDKWNENRKFFLNSFLAISYNQI